MDQLGLLPSSFFKVGNNALKIMDWILEEMAQSFQGSDDRDLRNAYLGK